MGIPQEFDREKLRRSIENSGVPTTVALQISSEVNPREDMTTEEIRKMVAKRLSEVNPGYAASYESTRKLHVRGSAYVGKGVCRLNEEFMNRIGLKSGTNIMVVAGESQVGLRAEAVPSLSSRELLINDSDLNRLNTSSGSRVEIKLQGP